MRRRKLECLTVTLCLFFGYFGRSRSIEDVPEFQYPCYVDICTFPRQFCNSDRSERRCSPCSTSICEDGRIPLACKYHCNKIQNALSKTTTSLDTKPSPRDESETDFTSVYLIVAYNAVLTTLFVMTVIISCVCYIQRKRKDKGQNERHSQQLRYQSNVGGARDPASQVLLQALIPNDDSAPPSYSTRDHVGIERTNAATGTEVLENNQCRPETAENETQTTPKSAGHLSFEFSDDGLKSRDI